MSKKLAFGALGLLLLATPLASSAQVSSSVQAQIDALLQQITQLQAQIAALRAQSSAPASDSSRCLDLSNALVIGSTDAATNGEVSKLQRFLVAAGVYTEARITGYYGSLTAQAVVRWQKAHGMDFVTTSSGVGPMTRDKLRVQCGVTANVSSCVGQDKFKPLITSIVPSSAPVGTRIQINGCNLSGFEADLDAAFVRSDGAIIPLNGGTLYRKNIEAAEPQSMTVTFQTYCPSGSVIGAYSGLEQKCTTVDATPGVYQVHVTTPEGTSNTVTFTALGATSSGTFSVSPTSGQAPLAVTFAGSLGAENIEFGDGSTSKVAYTCTGGKGSERCSFSMGHTYVTPGTYTAKLTEYRGSCELCMDRVRYVVDTVTITVR